MPPNNSNTIRKECNALAVDDDVISRIYLIRHGDRFDYANPSWLDAAKEHGTLITDPPLSALGHRQARQAAEQLLRITKGNDPEKAHQVDKILGKAVSF